VVPNPLSIASLLACEHLLLLLMVLFDKEVEANHKPEHVCLLDHVLDRKVDGSVSQNYREAV
jgi:hypothetical protein